MRRSILIFSLLLPLLLKAQKPVMKWDFETIKNRKTIDLSGSIADTIEGNFEEAAGVTGKGIRLDGFTTRIIRDGRNLPKPGSEFTIEAWVSLGEYPWNWCPLLTTESNETKGYRLMIGPYGQVSMEAAIAEQWVACISEQEVLPLRKWMHIAGVYRAGKELDLYVNGELIVSQTINGSLTYPKQTNCIIGMVAVPGKPSDIDRVWGTVAAYYGLDGIIDEISVYDKAVTADKIKEDYSKYSNVGLPDIAPRKLPKLENNPHRFGAYYTKLKYYPGWDNLWPVDQDPDIVVCFDKSPVKVIFWRGTRYEPSWVSENDNWMTDQSVETWGLGANDNEGCFEHMQDRHCRFSHVRIIENNDARVVVHWRYAPVSSHDNTWMPDPKTGWEAWIDEYYYIYPDGSAIRKVSWNKGTLGENVQYQESLPLLHPGQMTGELLNVDYVHVADYNYNIKPVSFVEDPDKQPTDWARKFTIQQYNFKSVNKPYICFEPGNEMTIRWNALSTYDKHVGCDHFPVGQAPCDGRRSKMSDRPSHCDSFPISDPVINHNGNRDYWNALYGMSSMNMTDLVSFGRSWAYAAEMSVSGTGFISKGYDKSQRCYQLVNTGNKTQKAEITLQGSKDSPVINPAFYIKNWNSEGAKILVNGKETKCRIGINHDLDGTNLVIFIPVNETKTETITIIPL
jgi:hypothetical protein